MDITRATTVSLVLNEHADTQLGIDWERFRTVLLDRLPIFGSA